MPLIRVRCHETNILVGYERPTDTEYDEFLASDEWRRQRSEALEKSGHLCKWCRKSEDLQVHHSTYYRYDNDPAGMIRGDLVVLCRKCHEFMHGGKFDDDRTKYVLEGHSI